jgi:alkylresorcinol/alkylpyrone synthase
VNAAILSVGTAVPDRSFSQEQVLSFVLERFNIRERTRQLYRKVLSHPSIARRYFAFEHLEDALAQSLDRKNARFEKEAPRLAARALMNALATAHLKAQDIAYLAAATCTGYVCPGLSSHVVEMCGLDASVRVADLVGMGCGAALPALEQAVNFAKAHPGRAAAVVCSEICSATFVSNDDPDIVISNAIFSDGAAAVLVRCDDEPSGLVVRDFAARTFPQWRDELRFVSENGHLKNTLSRNVPAHAAQAVREVITDICAVPSSLGGEGRVRAVAHWVLHAGGEKVIAALAAELKLTAADVAGSRAVLKNYGNMSSPTVLFVLDEVMRTRAHKSGDMVAMASFGAGFSAYAALLEWI